MAEVIAGEVAREIAGFGPVVLQKLRLGALQLASVGKPAVLEEAAQHFGVPVVVTWVYNDTWRLTQVASRVEAIDMIVNGQEI